MIFDEDDMKAGLRRLGAHADAQNFLRQYLMQELVTVTGPALSDGAARYCEGRRSFALALMRDLGLSEREDSDGGRTDSGIAGGRRGRSVGSSDSGAGRRVPPTDDRQYS